MKITHALIFAATLGTALFPSAAFALSSQQILNQATQLNALQEINVMDGIFSMQTTKTPLPAMKKQLDGRKSDMRVHSHFERPLGLSENFQGYVEMQSYFDTATGSSTPVTFNPSPRVTFRQADREIYFQLSGIASLLQTTGLAPILTPEQITGLEQWVHVDSTDADESAMLPSSLSSASATEERAKFIRLFALASAKKVPLLNVVSTTRQKDQPTLLRLGVRVNPAFLSLAQTQLLKEAGKDVAKRKEVINLFTSVRDGLKNTKMVAVVHTSVVGKPKLTRIEISDTKTSIEKGCAYKRLDKHGVGIESSYSCNVNTMKSVDTMNGFLNLSNDPSVQVVAPSNPASLKVLLNQLLQQIMGGDTEATSTTSTVSSI